MTQKFLLLCSICCMINSFIKVKKDDGMPICLCMIPVKAYYNWGYRGGARRTISKRISHLLDREDHKNFVLIEFKYICILEFYCI